MFAEADNSNDLDLISAILTKRAAAEAAAARLVDPLKPPALISRNRSRRHPQERRSRDWPRCEKSRNSKPTSKDAQKQIAELTAVENRIIRKNLAAEKGKGKNKEKVNEWIRQWRPGFLN